MRTSPEAIAAAIVDAVMPPPSAPGTLWQALSPEIAEVNDGRVNALWERLVARLVKDIPEHIREKALNADKRVTLLTSLKEELSEPQRRALFLLGEAEDIDRNSRCDAAYLVGVEIGRRLAARTCGLGLERGAQ